MNILKEYTLDFICRNKKNSISIMIAILISTTLLSALSGFLYTMYTDNIRLIILDAGNWHAELFDITTGDKLKYVTGHPNVEAVMIKGTWKTAKIDDPRRPYLVMRGLTSNYWNDMPDHTAIMEGRMPQSESEIAVSKQYFENHPDLKIGDSIHLPIGSRIFNGKSLDFNDSWKDGEIFIPAEEHIYTIVGKMDVTTNSKTPAYMAYGYINEKNILPSDQLTVYMRFKNPRTAYEDIVRIAQSVGYKPNEYGDYLVKTNNKLLSQYLIFSPKEDNDIKLSHLSKPLMFVTFVLLAASVFVFIIHNAFAMSANARLKQLGMLQSIGASPKQIRHSVVFEALALALIPIPLGIAAGWALNLGLFAYINSIKTLRDIDIIFTFEPTAVLLSAALALITVWLSALLPAWKISRLSPIEAIRQGGDIKIKKIRKAHLISKVFGMEGELAKNALYARKKSYRTAVISLTLSFALLSIFLNLIAIIDARTQVQASAQQKKQQRDISLYIEDGNLTDPEFEAEIRSITDVKGVLFASSVSAGLWIKADMASEELQALGGFERIINNGKCSVYEENGKIRIRTNLIALDDKSFASYCAQIGTDPSVFYGKNTVRAIVINRTLDDIHSNLRKDVAIPFLKLNIRDKLNCMEKVYLKDTGDHSFNTEIGFITDQLPPIDYQYENYQLTQVLPRSAYFDLIEHFTGTRSIRARNVFASVIARSEEAIQPAADKIQTVCDKWYGSGDYSIWNILEKRQTANNSKAVMKTVLLLISVFLALIGVSNVFSTVSGNLAQRRKEFAMLRSVGISPKGIHHMLILEALFFGILPIALSIPLNIIVVAAFLKINMVYMKEFLPFMPILPIVIFGAAILFSVMLVYALGSRKLRQDAIVDVLKDESM